MILGIIPFFSNAQTLKSQYQYKVFPPASIKNMDAASQEYVMQDLRKREGIFSLVSCNGKIGFALKEIPDNGIYEVNGNDCVYMDINNNEKYSMQNIIDKPFLVKDGIRAIDWNISDETKEILGYTCRKATHGDTTAWYCEQIPMSIGPSGAIGLPGLIMEMKTQLGIYTAINIKTDKSIIEIEMPTKHKAITRSKFNQTLRQKLKEMGIDGNAGKGTQVKVVTLEVPA